LTYIETTFCLGLFPRAKLWFFCATPILQRRVRQAVGAPVPLQAGENEVIAGGVDSPFVFSVFIA
jgi:hypothetical protein